LNASEESLRKLRGKELTSIQQDPVSSLNPAFTIQDQIVDIIRLHKMINKEKSISEAEKLLKGLGIADAKRVMGRYPHQISGGMAQRVMLAIAFSCNPSLVIADEPTTALDVITQATVIELMKSMQTRLGTSILFITHNLGLASKICDYVTVMYAGKIVESGTARQVFENPSHPYTQALLASVPKPTDTSTRLSTIEGSLPNIAPPQKGCRFYDRCKVAMDICRETEEIPYVEINQQVEHTSLCLRAKEVSDKLI